MIYETGRFSGKVELSTMWKRFLLTTAFASLFFVFAACDDDGSSVVEPGDESSSAICEDCDDSSSSVKSSSSVAPKSSESAKSSSSVIPASSGNLQSSSSKKESSSSTKSSSSSVKSSSSAKSSSSVTPKSSSSLSSSSEYVPYNHQKVFSSDSLLSGAYKQFTDKRNGRKYYYLTINGENKDGQAASVTVMAENLNIGEMVDGAKDQSNDSKIERYCYNDDTTNCDRYGGLYQWAEMMLLPSECNTKSCADQIKPKHQGICPDGWRLLTYDDFYIVVHADGNDAGVKGVRAMGFGGHNYSGYSLIGGGVMDYDGETPFADLNESAYWYYPEEQDKRENRAAGTFVNKSLNTFSKGYNSKSDGFSVRCVMVE